LYHLDEAVARLGDLFVIRPLRLMTLAPGHFHAALVQKQMPPGVHPRAYVYAPLDYDLLTHLARVVSFNTRSANPTTWELDVRAGGDYLERMLRETPGNTVVIAGRNRSKIDSILAAASNNLHVLADKPWVIRHDDFPKLEQVFQEAELRDVVVWDMMTERFEVTTVLLRELMSDPEVFGAPVAGSADEPGLTLESVHYLKKTVAGAPLRRPAWWFDATQAGPALGDVGTHLADLAMWLLFPEQPIDARRDVQIHDATVWPTPLSRDQLLAITVAPEPPPGLADGLLLYFGNGTVSYSIRGVWVRLTVMWEYESAEGRGDTHEAVARGTNARIEVRPSADGPLLSVVPAEPSVRADVAAAVRHRCTLWQDRFPGVAVRAEGDRLHLDVPERHRTGHEAHFDAVVREFLSYFHLPRQVPNWERANMLAKYHLTTTAVEIALAKLGPLTVRAH
jgi:predicted dehydrogenase